MSAEYDEYLREHISMVNRAALWMLDNLAIVEELSDDDVDSFLANVALHDRSKYGFVEYWPYDSYFYGKKDQDTFNVAWLHHIHNNAHHWQHWLLMNDDGGIGDDGKMIALEMPRIYVLEMIADWWSFSWLSDDLGKIFDWYAENRDHIILHESTRKYVEAVLDEMRELV